MKSCYLLDTNIISELRKPAPNENVLKSFVQKKMFSDISSITWAESLAGVKRMPESKKKEALTTYYNEIIREQFDIIPFDEHAANIYSDLYPKLEALGRIPPNFDLQIASIAIANNMILVTRNTKDFEDICSVSNLMVENWFQLEQEKNPLYSCKPSTSFPSSPHPPHFTEYFATI